MGLWGSNTSSANRPKFLPEDDNASGSMGARQNAIATSGGWALASGLAASGNDNKDAQPEILVCIRNLAAIAGSATVRTIDWTDGAYADSATFDLTITFDEAIDMTSAALSANQVITNKAFILLNRIGFSDMEEDNTIAAQYHSGSGTNQIVFRGEIPTGRAGFIGFNTKAIVFDGTSQATEEDGVSILAIRQEGGTDAVPAGRIVLDSAAAIVGTVNGAITTATTALVLDGNSGTIAVGMKVYGQNNATSITDENGSTDLSQDGSLTVTATNGSTSVTLSRAITVANDIILNFSADGHDSLCDEGLDLIVQGDSGSTDVTALTRTGEDTVVLIGALEQGTDGSDSGGSIILDATAGSSANEFGGILAEDKTSDIVLYSQISDNTGTIVLEDGTGDSIVLNGIDSNSQDANEDLIQESGSLTSADVLGGVTVT